MKAKGRATARELSIGQLVGESLRRVRARGRLTQAQVAERCQALGLPLTMDAVTYLETGRRDSIDFGTMVSLCAALTLQLTDLFEANAWVRLTPDLRIHSNELRRWVWGALPDMGFTDLVVELRGRTRRVFQDEFLEDMRRSGGAVDDYLASRLGLRPEWLTYYAIQRWGISATARRDQLLGDVSSMPKDELRARRGRVTRDLRRELEAFISDFQDRKEAAVAQGQDSGP